MIRVRVQVRVRVRVRVGANLRMHKSAEGARVLNA